MRVSDSCWTSDSCRSINIQCFRSILSWENKVKTVLCFVAFLLVAYYIQPWMVTLALLFPFIRNILVRASRIIFILFLLAYTISNWASVKVLSVTDGWNYGEDDLDDDEDEEDSANSSGKDGGEKRSLKEKMQAIQDITLMVQNFLGTLAHILESLGNIFNFSVPFLSWLAMFVLTVATILLYYVPLRSGRIFSSFALQYLIRPPRILTFVPL